MIFQRNGTAGSSRNSFGERASAEREKKKRNVHWIYKAGFYSRANVIQLFVSFRANQTITWKRAYAICDKFDQPFFFSIRRNDWQTIYGCPRDKRTRRKLLTRGHNETQICRHRKTTLCVDECDPPFWTIYPSVRAPRPETIEWIKSQWFRGGHASLVNTLTTINVGIKDNKTSAN